MRSIGIALGISLLASVAVGQTAEKCSAMAGVALDRAKATATIVAAGSGVDGVRLRPAVANGLPAFCRVMVVDRPSEDSEIRTEVWLPVEAATAGSSAALRNDDKGGWNGKFRGQGNGGFAGTIDYADMAAAVAEGYVTAGTDTGHTGGEPAFALGHPEKVVDYGWRAVHDMTVEAKALTAAFYGKAATKSYFASCSNGGREGLMEAQRFPADYDGILAGDPSWNFTTLVGSGATMLKTFYTRPDGLLPASKIPAIAAAVRTACDAQDGVTDGVVNDPLTCHFDPAVLACKEGDSDACLTPGQVATVRDLYATKTDAVGNFYLHGFLPGGEEGLNGWPTWITGGGGRVSSAEFFSAGFQRNFVQGRTDWAVAEFDPAKDLPRAEKIAAAVDAREPNLKAFFARGGKLVLYHGWNDPAIPAQGTVDYFDQVRAAVGPKAADASMLLYMVPGMQHCSAGPGATEFGQGGSDARRDAGHDVFTALEGWVEAGKAPGVIVAKKTATKASPTAFTRPLCVYPQVGKYAKGDPNDAGSFVCAAP